MAPRDVSMGGLLDPNKNSPNKQESKAKNGLFEAPQVVVVAVVHTCWLGMFDQGKGRLC